MFRHVLFWTAWAAYFVLCDYLFRQPRPDVPTYGTPKTGYLTLGSNWLIKTCLLLSLYAGVCYFFINILLPQIIQRQWIKASINTFLLCLILFLLASFMYWNVFSFIDSLSGINKAANYFAPFWPPLYLGVINAGKVVASAAIIKSVKYWWLKQKEKEKLEREKMIAELQLLKAQIRPDFLFGALSNIQTHSLNASARAPEQIW